MNCPKPTQDAELNLANQKKAMDKVGYGPKNTDGEDESFWEKKASSWDLPIAEAKRRRCGNCSVYNQTSDMMECISSGSGEKAVEPNERKDVGYCESLNFVCSSKRTCDAWSPRKKKEEKVMVIDTYFEKINSFLNATELKESYTVDMETKVRNVQDSSYWGKPVGTPITPGMKPEGPKSPIGRARAAAAKKPKASSNNSPKPTTKPKKRIASTKPAGSDRTAIAGATSSKPTNGDSEFEAMSQEQLSSIWKESNQDEKDWNSVANSQRESAARRSEARREAGKARERRDRADAEMMRRVQEKPASSQESGGKSKTKVSPSVAKEMSLRWEETNEPEKRKWRVSGNEIEFDGDEGRAELRNDVDYYIDVFEDNAENGSGAERTKAKRMAESMRELRDELDNSKDNVDAGKKRAAYHREQADKEKTRQKNRSANSGIKPNIVDDNFLDMLTSRAAGAESIANAKNRAEAQKLFDEMRQQFYNNDGTDFALARNEGAQEVFQHRFGEQPTITPRTAGQSGSRGFFGQRKSTAIDIYFKKVDSLLATIEFKDADVVGTYDFDMETKVRKVKDSAYWGKPVGTPITPGMKPEGPKSPIGRARAAAGKKPKASGGSDSPKPKKRISVGKKPSKPAGSERTEVAGSDKPEIAGDKPKKPTGASPKRRIRPNSGKPKNKPTEKPTKDESPFSTADAKDFSVAKAAEELKIISKEGRADGDGSITDPKDVGKDIELALKYLNEVPPQHIRMDSHRELSTLMDRLAEIGNDARAKGEKAPKYDLCKVSVPGTNLFCSESKNVKRENMPQFKGVAIEGSYADQKQKENGDKEADIEAEFREMLTSLGISTEVAEIPASELKATQDQLVGPQVAGMAQAIEDGTFPQEVLDSPIFVTKDGYVLDGHHRWAALVAIDMKDGKQGDVDIKVEIIDAEIGYILDLANGFAKIAGVKPKDG